MSDYGMRPNRAAKRMLMHLAIILVALAVGGVAFLLWSNSNSRDRAIANSTASLGGGAVAGPPCDPGTPQGKLGRGDVWKTSAFNGVEYGRRNGDIDCGTARDRSLTGLKTLCQFNAPAELRIVAKDGTHYFDLGLGNPATVVVSDSGVACFRTGQAG